MKAIEMTMKSGAVQSFRFFDNELGAKAYVTITTAMDNYKPFRNDTQELVTFACEDGEATLVLDQVSAVTISGVPTETHLRETFEYERKIRALREEIMPTIPRLVQAQEESI